jgi:hypothetical protein
MSLSINFVVANIAAVVQLIPLCQGLKRLVRIIWVYFGIIVRNDGALSAGKKAYIYLCVACAQHVTHSPPVNMARNRPVFNNGTEV